MELKIKLNPNDKTDPSIYDRINGWEAMDVSYCDKHQSAILILRPGGDDELTGELSRCIRDGLAFKFIQYRDQYLS